ncbi:MAG: hypothetical protein FWC67_02855, partial [Defluviitaleaceae bacterium]|nr:hypothetical protein [Defluviitaleaceae bacterium]
DEKYKNPRNLCAGTIRQLNSRVAASRNVDFYAFAVLNDIDFNEKSQTLKFLQDMGFDTPCYDEVDADGVTAAVESFKNAVEDLDYATDGLVLTYDNIEYSESLGATSKFPRDSIAFKWADELVRTRLLDIEWNTSRTGLINPIAIFEAVDIEGSNVERASLHNLSIVESLELGKNDEISVYKANMIIPQIAENFTRSGGMLPPNNCPVCEAPTHIKDEKGVKTLHCTNPNCKARVVRTIVHYASRDAANIDGLSIQTIEKFIELGFLSNFSDIYKLGAHEAQIVALHGFGEKSFAKLMASVEKSKDMSMANFIYGLGIDDVGLAGAKDLCRHFNYDFEAVRRAEPLELAKIEGFGGGTVAALYEYFKNFEQDEDISKEELASFISKICKENNIKNMGPLRVEDMCRHFDYDIKNIIGATFQDFATIKTYVRKDGKLVEGGNFGGVIAANIYEYFQNESNNRIVDAAGSHVRFAAETAPVAAEDSPIFGKTFVITGDLTHFKNRKELVDKIEVAGGKVAGSVSKKTDYLINNDTQSASSKNKKAQELGVSIISEQDFLDLC